MSSTRHLNRFRFAGPVITAILAGLLFLLHESPYRIPEPAPILLVAILFSAFTGGTAAGLLSTAIGLLYLAFVFGTPRRLVPYTAEDARRFITFGAAGLVLTFFMSYLRSMLDTLYLRERAARQAAEEAERRASFLAEASRVLGISLNYEMALKSVARLSVPTLADWCIVYMLADDGVVERFEVAVADPADEPLARELQRHRIRVDRTHPVIAEVVAGHSVLLREVPDSLLDAIAEDPDHRTLLERIHPRAAMIVPLAARGHMIGAMVFLATTSDRTYDDEDLAIAEEIGRRAALAVDNARLYEAALAADRAKADFLAIMSHELRTPLTAIIGYTDLLKSGISGPLTETQKAQLERIEANARHLLALVEDILTYARSETDREEVRIEEVDFFRLVRDTAALMQHLALAKGLGYSIRVPDRECRVLTDPAKLRQILVNLISNAIKFTREGEVRVTAEAEDGWLAAHVSDTGIGIAPEDRRRIFEPFWQAEHALTRGVGGAGLGITIARRLAMMLGGEISVTSEPGVGSTFTVRIPAIPATERPVEAAPRTEPASAHTAEQPGRRNEQG